VKLLATFCLAALSLTGCATDDETNMGGYLSGMRPAKPSLDDGSGTPPRPAVDEDMQKAGNMRIHQDLRGIDVVATTVAPWFPLPDNVCGDNCTVVLIPVPEATGSEVGRIDVYSDGGDKLCSIYQTSDNSYDTKDCANSKF
jgi:hypothetical protein